MIRIECFVEDKDLARVIHLLAGSVLNLNVQPVVNEKVKKGKVVPAGDFQPGFVRVYARLKANGKEYNARIVSEDIKDAMKAEKISVGSYSSISTSMKENHMLDPVGRGMFVFKDIDSQAYNEENNG